MSSTNNIFATNGDEQITTGLPEEVSSEKKIIIKFSKEGGLMYDLNGQWTSFEILGILDVIKEQIKSDMVLIPKINNIVAASSIKPAAKNNSLKEKLEALIAEE